MKIMTAGKKIQILIIVVIMGLLTIAVQAQTKDSTLTVSNNPFASQTVLTIPNLSNDTLTLKIYNSLGLIVANFYEDTIITGTITITFYADTLPNGFYFIMLTINSVDYTYKVLKNSSLNTESLTIEKEFTIFPQPTTNKVFIKSKSKIIEVRIFDCNGRKVLEQKNDYNNGIDLTDLKNGIYLLYLMTEDKLFIEKVIKQ